MDIEDLVYKSGPDGKPKPKRNQPLNSYVTRTGQSVTAHSFAAAVKADLDVKEALRRETVGVQEQGRFAARRGDSKGHSKNIYQGTARMGETLVVNKDTVVESAITQEQLKDFFKDQPLQGGSDFSLVPPQPPQPPQPLAQGGDGDGSINEKNGGSDVLATGSESPNDSELQKQSHDALAVLHPRHRQHRRSSDQLEYLYRASTLQSTTQSRSTPSPSKYTQKVLQSRRRKSKRTPLEEEDWRDAMTDSLIRMYEIQARLEAEKQQGSSLLKKMGQLFSWSSDTVSNKHPDGPAYSGRPGDTSPAATQSSATNPSVLASAKGTSRPAITSNPYVKRAKGRKAKSNSSKQPADSDKDAARGKEGAEVDVNSPGQIKSFTSMFRLPSLLTKSRSGSGKSW